jgi:GntR family transcriptional regulator
MLRVKVDRDEPTQLYEQVAGEIRRAIADGEAKPGERLPPARDLAAVLGVNTNTVLRALRQLRDEGLLEFRRGRGISVAGTPQRGAVVEKARELVRFARQHGYLTRPEKGVRRGRRAVGPSAGRTLVAQPPGWSVPFTFSS